MSFPIKSAFSLTPRRRGNLQKRIDDGTAIGWFDKSTLRLDIKKHLANQQGLRCCYCLKPINTDHGRFWDLDHILPESGFVQFFFDTKNHAASCPQCNTAKSNKIVVVAELLDAVRAGFFPLDKDAYTIPHPHLENPEDFIFAIFMGAIEYFEPIQAKGEELISVCGLDERTVTSAKLREIGVRPELMGAFEEYDAAVKSGKPVRLLKAIHKFSVIWASAS